MLLQLASAYGLAPPAQALSRVPERVASFTPVRATKALGSKLRVGRGSLLLYLQQVDYDQEGRPVLSSHEHHVADAFEFTLIRRGPGRRFT